MSHRPERLASAIRDAVSPLLRQCPPECGIVSLTEISVTKDFAYADLSVSALAEPERAIAFLEKRKGTVRKQLSSLSLHTIPQLRFRIDPGPALGTRIDELLS